jgi:hypothetical protein
MTISVNILYVHTRHIYVGHSSSLLKQLVNIPVTKHKLNFFELSTTNKDSFLNEFAQILTSKRVDLVFFDYLHEYVDIFSSIDLIANFFKVKIFGIFSSKFLRDLSRNQSIRNDYEYLKDFDSLKMFTYDDLINSDTL